MNHQHHINKLLQGDGRLILDQNYYHHCTTAHKDIKLHKTETGIGECAYTNWGEDGGQDADAEAEAERDEAKQHRFTGVLLPVLERRPLRCADRAYQN